MWKILFCVTVVLIGAFLVLINIGDALQILQLRPWNRFFVASAIASQLAGVCLIVSAWAVGKGKPLATTAAAFVAAVILLGSSFTLHAVHKVQLRSDDLPPIPEAYRD